MSKQKMRGAFAIVLSVVMLLGCISMGVFAEDAEPAHKVLATATGMAEGNVLPDFQDVEVELKAGESVYVVVDPVNADGQLQNGGWKGVLPKEDITVTLNGETKAKFGASADSYGADIPKYDYYYSYTARSAWDAAADKTALLLDNLTAMGAFTAGQWDNAGWMTGTPFAAAPVAYGMVGLVGTGEWGAMLSNSSDDYVARAVLKYTATEAGTYVVDSGAFNSFGDVTLYLLQDKAAENTSSGSESSASESSNPAPSASESSEAGCEHKKATEVKDTAKAPTCTEKGKAADKVCPDCQATIKGAEIAALGHSFTEGKPLCSVCGGRNPDYVYVPEGPYYKLTASKFVDQSDIKEANMPANADMAAYEFSDGKYYPLAVSQKITLKKGEVAYIVIDPTDEEGNLVPNVNTLEWYMHIFDTTGLEVATFQREQSGGLGIGREQNEHGLTFAYSYTDKVNWTKETSNNLLLDNYTELVYTSINEAPQFSMTACWVAPEGKPGADMQVGIINGHGKPFSAVNDDYITRLVLAFEAPADDTYTINAFASGTAHVRFLQTDYKKQDNTTAGGNNNAGGSSPTTGVDTFVWPVALVALVTMATGVVLCTKKSRAK